MDCMRACVCVFGPKSMPAHSALTNTLMCGEFGCLYIRCVHIVESTLKFTILHINRVNLKVFKLKTTRNLFRISIDKFIYIFFLQINKSSSYFDTIRILITNLFNKSIEMLHFAQYPFNVLVNPVKEKPNHLKMSFLNHFQEISCSPCIDTCIVGLGTLR